MTPPFAEMVRRRISERGLGLREFCRAVALDPSFFSKVLAGKRSPPSEDVVLRRIAAFLEFDACELIVAAGRIPREWDRLWKDRPLLEEVHRLCQDISAGNPPLPPKAHGKGRVDPVPGLQPGRQPFGDELL